MRSCDLGPRARRLRFEALESRRLLSITVDTLVDENNGVGAGAGTSLREAILAAVAGDTIDFSVTGTINLSSGLPAISKNLTISGPGANLLTIQARDPTPGTKNGDGSRVFTITDSNTTNLLDVSISGLTLTGGDVNFGGGGGIWTTENLVVSDCVISNCAAISGSYQQTGGGILSDAGPMVPANSLTVRNCILTGNTALNSEGGAIRKRYGTLLIEDCTITGNSAYFAGGGVDAADGGVAVQINRSNISNNRTTYPTNQNYGYGGGVFLFRGTLTVADSTISGNTASRGGGIYTSTGGLTLTDSVISNNTATGSTSAFGGAGILSPNYAISLTRCTVSGNTAATKLGGGLLAAYITLLDSTISGNSATAGGGLYTFGGKVVNSTISSNTAISNGGGGAIRSNSGTLRINSSTITANTSPTTSQGAVRSATTYVTSSIIAGNTNGDITATVTSFGYNLVGTGSITAFNKPGDQTGVTNPMLGPLADNGGPRKTHLPLSGSPAVDTGNPAFNPADPDGNPATNDAMPYDERGAPFTRVYGGRIDKGAVERQPVSGTVMGDYNGDGIVDAADYVVWRMNQGATGVTPYTGADGSGNGIIDEADYSLWRFHFGSTVPVAGSGAGVDGGGGRVEAAGKAEGGGRSSKLRANGSVFSTTGQVRHGESQATSSGTRLRALAEPVAPEILRDDALVAWVATRSVERVSDSGDVGDATSDQSNQQVSDDLVALDVAFGALVSAAVR